MGERFEVAGFLFLAGLLFLQGTEAAGKIISYSVVFAFNSRAFLKAAKASTVTT